MSYAVDEKTKVAQDRQFTRAISKGAIAQGVLKLTRTQRQTTVYKIAAPVAEERRLMIEHPKTEGWKLVEPGGAELTASAYRFTVDLKAGETKTVTVTFESPVIETLRVADMPKDIIAEVTDILAGPDGGYFAAIVFSGGDIHPSESAIQKAIRLPSYIDHQRKSDSGLRPSRSVLI